MLHGADFMSTFRKVFQPPEAKRGKVTTKAPESQSSTLTTATEGSSEVPSQQSESGQSSERPETESASGLASFGSEEAGNEDHICCAFVATGERPIYKPLRLIRVSVKSCEGRWVNTVVLVDPGSSRTWIAKDLAMSLGLEYSLNFVERVHGIHGPEEVQTGYVNFDIKGRGKEHSYRVSHAQILPGFRLTESSVPMKKWQSKFKYLQDLNLDDIDYTKTQVIIGEDYEYLVFPIDGTVRCGPDRIRDPVAYDTLLGWTVNGEYGGPRKSLAQSSTSFVASSEPSKPSEGSVGKQLKEHSQLVRVSSTRWEALVSVEPKSGWVSPLLVAALIPGKSDRARRFCDTAKSCKEVTLGRSPGSAPVPPNKGVKPVWESQVKGPGGELLSVTCEHLVSVGASAIPGRAAETARLKKVRGFLGIPRTRELTLFSFKNTGLFSRTSTLFNLWTDLSLGVVTLLAPEPSSAGEIYKGGVKNFPWHLSENLGRLSLLSGEWKAPLGWKPGQGVVWSPTTRKSSSHGTSTSP